MAFFRFYFFLFLILLSGILYGQNVFVIDSVPAVGKNIETNFLIQNGDNPTYKLFYYDDSKWDTIDPAIDDDFEFNRFKSICWFRFHFIVDSSLNNIPLSFEISQTGASEIYLDGNLIGGFGTVSLNGKDEVRETSLGMPIPFNYKPGREHILAIRYSNHNIEGSYNASGIKMAGLTISVHRSQNSTLAILETQNIAIGIGYSLTVFYLVLGFVHLLLWFFYKSNRGNLYYFLFTFNLAIFPFFICLTTTTGNMLQAHCYQLILLNAIPLIFLSLLNLVYHFFYENFPKRFKWYIASAIIVCCWKFFYWPGADFVFIAFPITATFDTLFTVIIAVRKRQRGSKIIGAGILFFAGFILFALASIVIASLLSATIFLGDSTLGSIVLILFILALASIPISMSIFLAKDFAETSTSLKLKLHEVESLSLKSIEQEKEKQRILETEKERLEFQVVERTSEITEQKKVIEEKNKDITDSILYAKKIQDAMLPAADVTKQLFPSSFILFKPKDIVSGDFYWVHENKDFRFIAAADCTGHGVPGALMSMTGNNFLNQLVNERNLISTKEILTHLDEAIRKSLKQERADVESKDGMDIALCRFNTDFTEVLYSGANRPLWIIRNGEILEFKPEKKSIGGSHGAHESSYSEKSIPLEKNDCIYIFSDGFADQFGGPEGKKFMSKKLKDIFKSFGTTNIEEQKAKLETVFLSWKQNVTQVDDVLVIGIKI